MNKRLNKRLLLSKETLRNLSEGNLRGARGGGPTRTCIETNLSDCQGTCLTCDAGCSESCPTAGPFC
jgi:hypothetical protein